jgi:hypothetical protein
MTGLLLPNDLTPLEKLLLNAGQLSFPGPGKEARAVALALTALVDEAGTIGAVGQGSLPDGPYLRAIAEGLVSPVTLTPPMLMQALDMLIWSEFLTCDEIAPGVPYTVRTTCKLPQRHMHTDDCASDDAYTHGVESDTFGLGDLP